MPFFKNILFNKYEIRVLLAGIKSIYGILLYPINQIKCDNLILINSNLDFLFSYCDYIIDNDFNNNLEQLKNHKINIINNINFKKYKLKLKNY